MHYTIELEWKRPEVHRNSKSRVRLARNRMISKIQSVFHSMDDSRETTPSAVNEYACWAPDNRMLGYSSDNGILL